MRKSGRPSWLILLLFVLSCLANLSGQTTTGTFAGSVSDASGASVPQAQVTAVNVDTGQKYRAVTSVTGDFTVVQVQPGNYEVDVVAQGFKTLSRKSLRLEVAGKMTLDLRLEVGVVSESVSVTGEAPMLRTQDAQVGEIIDSLMVENLPQLDRNPLDMLKLTGNVSGSGSPGASGSDVRINGGRMQGLDILVDGNTVLSGKAHAIGAGGGPTMEQVEEFKVITNGIPAEYGRVSGGLVTVATKGGTNGLHGQGFEYFRNQLFNANSWEQNWQSTYVAGQKAARTQFHQNDYGGAIGGPVILPKIYNGKNKTFFFFNFEQAKYRTGGVTHLGMAASEAERNGDLSRLIANGSPAMMYDPLGEVETRAVPDTALAPGCPITSGCEVKLTLFPNNGTTIPASRLDGYAKEVDGLMPKANRTPTPGWSQMAAYVGYQSNFSNNTQWETRIDHSITDNSRLTLRFNRQNSVGGYSSWYNELDPGNQNSVPGALNGSLGWTWMVSPTTIVELRGSVTYSPGNGGYFWPNNESDWPIDPVMMALTGGSPGGIDNRVWSSNGSGWGDYPGVQNQDVAAASAYTTYDGVAAVTKIWGKHTLKTGFETRRMYDNHWEKLYGPANYQGSATVQSNDNRWDDTINHNSMGNGYANAWGSWLLGMPDNVSQSSRLVLLNAQNYYASYLQDDFKVSKRLTLNLGVRWDMETPLTERHNNIYAWNPNSPSAYKLPAGFNWTSSLQQAGLTAAQIAQVPTPSWVTNGKLPNGAPCYAGSSQCRSNVLFQYHPWQFAPRLAGAYQLDSKTVLRASWGMMYLTATGDFWDSWVSDQFSASTPYPPDRANGNTGTQLRTNMNMFSPSEIVPFNKTNAALNQTIGSFAEQAGTDVNRRPPLEQNWNFSVQRQLPGNFLLEAGYNGNHSGDLVTAQALSPFPTSLVNPKYGSLFQTQVANPLVGQVQAINSFSQATVPLGILMLSNPAFGGLNLYGQNIGRANYNAGTLKLQKRFSQGLTFLFTYTYSKSLDNVGSTAGIAGNGGSKASQSFQTVDNLYGYSPMDMTHRLTFYHDYQVPFGRGRKFLGAPKGFGSKLLDGAVGGWEYAGIWIYHSGTPLSFSTLTGNVSITQGIATLFGNISGNMGQLTPSNYGNDNQLLTSSQTAVGNGGSDLGSAGIRRFNVSQFSNPAAMTPGNFPNVYPWIRNPGANSYDASLLKNFAIARDGKIYLQLRVEAQNLLNIRGLGNYITSYGDPNFGLITSSAKNPRNMQISARLFF